MKAQQEFQARNERRRTIRREHTLEEESPEDVRQRNRKEAEILAANLGEGGVGYNEIISEMSLLKELAQLQESMVNLYFLLEIRLYDAVFNLGMVFGLHAAVCERTKTGTNFKPNSD